MPTYQYACTECGHQLEAVQSFSDAPLSECPTCQGRLRKLFNSVGIVFKGSGFYRTDSRAGNGSGEATTTAADGTKDKAAAKNGSSESSAKPAGESSNGAGKSGAPAGASSGNAAKNGASGGGSSSGGSSTGGSSTGTGT